MDIFYVVFASVCLILPVSSTKNYVVKQDEHGFSVWLKQEDDDLLIIKHTKCCPCMYAGTGKTDFHLHEGNFHIKDYVNFKEPLSDFTVINNEDYVSILLTGTTKKNYVELKLSTTKEHQLEVKFEKFPDIYDRVWIRLQETENEHLYGGGEQFTHFDLNGYKFQIWTREQGIGRNVSSPLTYLAEYYAGGYGGDYDHTYFPQATFTSSRKYYCHVDGTSFMELNFEQDGFHEIQIFGRPSALLFNSDKTMTGVLQKLTSYLGRQPVLPDWLRSGVIMGMQGGTEVMKSNLEVAQSNGISVAGLWIQDWAGSIFTSFGKRVFWNWEWSETTYPGLDKEIKNLLDKGVRLLAYITPHMNIKGNLYQSNKDHDYFMKNTKGEVYMMNFGEFTCATVDLTKEDARTWYKGVITKNLIEFGFGGWMADFSEYIPADAVFASGETGATMHNKMPVLWAQLNREAVEEAGKLGEIYYFMRSGGPGTQAYSLVAWAGDQSVDFTYSDGLASTIPAALSLGMSGFGMTHFDIGGYTTIIRSGSTRQISFNVNLTRTEELFMRGAEMAVFTPIMRTHEGNVPMVNFQVYKDQAAMQKFSIFVNMFKAMADYTKELMQENSHYGIPLQRPLFLHYEDDCKSYSTPYEYMYGPDLLVAPVVESEKDKWSVYLPPDRWVHLFSGDAYEGGQSIEVAAPIGKPPVFYRQDTKWKDIFQHVADIANGINRVKSEL